MQNGFQPRWAQLWVNSWPSHNTKREEKKEVSPYQEKVLSYIKMECFQLSDKGFGTIIFPFSYLSALPTWLSSRLLASWDNPHSQKSHPHT